MLKNIFTFNLPFQRSCNHLKGRNIITFLIKTVSGFALLGTVFLPLIFFMSCTKDKNIVANFGDQQITLEEFKTAYIKVLKQADVYDSVKLRENFLDEMINRKLLAKEAQKVKLDDNEKFQMRVESFTNKNLREEHFEKVIQPKIDIDSTLVDQVYAFTKQQRLVKHLYFINKTDADSAYQLLLKGADFDELASQIFTDTVLSKNGGELGWIYWDQLDYNLAMTAFTQELSSFSKPVKSSFGYHIVMPIDFRVNPLLSEYEKKLNRDNVESLLEYKIGDQLAAEYVFDLMTKKNIQINTELGNFIYSKLQGTFKRLPTQYDGMSELQINDQELGQVEINLWDRRHEQLLNIDGGELTVGQFIGFLAYVPYSTIYHDFKGTLDYVVRDFAITNEAKKMNLADNSGVIRMKEGIYSDYLLQQAIKSKIVRSVTISEDEVQKRYDEKKEELYKNITYEKAQKVIHDDLLKSKRSKAVNIFLNELKNDITIIKKCDVIHEYYESVLQGEETEG